MTIRIYPDPTDPNKAILSADIKNFIEAYYNCDNEKNPNIEYAKLFTELSNAAGQLLWTNVFNIVCFNFETEMVSTIQNSLIFKVMSGSFIEIIKNSIDEHVLAGNNYIEIKITLEYHQDLINMTFTDNGRGFPETFLLKTANINSIEHYIKGSKSDNPKQIHQNKLILPIDFDNQYGGSSSRSNNTDEETVVSNTSSKLSHHNNPMSSNSSSPRLNRSQRLTGGNGKGLRQLMAYILFGENLLTSNEMEIRGLVKIKDSNISFSNVNSGHEGETGAIISIQTSTAPWNMNTLISDRSTLEDTAEEYKICGINEVQSSVMRFKKARAEIVKQVTEPSTDNSMSDDSPELNHNLYR